MKRNILAALFVSIMVISACGGSGGGGGGTTADPAYCAIPASGEAVIALSNGDVYRLTMTGTIAKNTIHYRGSDIGSTSNGYNPASGAMTASYNLPTGGLPDILALNGTTSPGSGHGTETCTGASGSYTKTGTAGGTFRLHFGAGGGSNPATVTLAGLRDLTPSGGATQSLSITSQSGNRVYGTIAGKDVAGYITGNHAYITWMGTFGGNQSIFDGYVNLAADGTGTGDVTVVNFSSGSAIATSFTMTLPAGGIPDMNGTYNVTHTVNGITTTGTMILVEDAAGNINPASVTWSAGPAWSGSGTVNAGRSLNIDFIRACSGPGTFIIHVSGVVADVNNWTATTTTDPASCVGGSTGTLTASK